MQVIPCTLTVLFQSHSQSINETFTEFGNDGLVRRLAKQRIERGQKDDQSPSCAIRHKSISLAVTLAKQWWSNY